MVSAKRFRATTLKNNKTKAIQCYYLGNLLEGYFLVDSTKITKQFMATFSLFLWYLERTSRLSFVDE